MKKYIILLISLIIDGLVPNITLFSFNNLTYFTPLCTITSLVIIYDDKKFIKLFLISSTLYGVLYMSNLLLAFILFFITMLVIKLMKRILSDNLFTIILQILLVITIYEGVFYIIYSLIFMNTFNINDYFYKISHSIVLNLLYGISIFYIYGENSSKLSH